MFQNMQDDEPVEGESFLLNLFCSFFFQSNNSKSQQKNVSLKLKKAKELAELNYKQHVKEAKQGLVSQLDVLRVLEESIQAQQMFDQQEFETKKAWVQLKVLAGVAP